MFILLFIDFFGRKRCFFEFDKRVLFAISAWHWFVFSCQFADCLTICYINNLHISRRSVIIYSLIIGMHPEIRTRSSI